MGCGGSKSTDRVESFERSNSKHTNTNGDIFNSDSDISIGTSHGSVSLKHQQVTPEHAIFKGIAFDVKVGENNKADLMMTKKPPHRLKKLENMPKLTAEMLKQKIDAAEENRKKELQRRVKKTLSKKKEQELSKRRKKLLDAKEFAAQKTLETKLVSYDKNRTKAQADIIAKQQRREERAKKVRNKAQKLKDGEDAEPVVIDPDETFNADYSEDEKWDDGEQTEGFQDRSEPYDGSSRNSTPNDNKEFDDFYDT